MLLEFITLWVTKFLLATGYPALMILMVLESMIFPVPSEAVMPFAGFLINSNQFSWLAVILYATLGTIIGSLISYAMGYYGGNKFIKKFGKYFFLDEKALVWTEHWFSKNGSKTIFISRFIPIVRHLISIPAGIGKMNMKKFIFYTFLGGILWNSFLTYLGVLLGENWKTVQNYSHVIDVIIILCLIAGIVWFIYRHIIVNQKPIQSE